MDLIDIPVPKIGADDVLIKIKATSICGTDVHIYKWDDWAQKRVKQIPLVQGHELCGVIEKLGKNVKKLKIGDFVSAESHIVDYNGEFYKKGLGHIAPETKIIGVDVNGSYAEYIALPWQNARKNPEGMSLSIAVLKENFGNAIHAAYKINLKGKNVLITGCGPVGLMTVLAARQQKARTIIASDISEYRLEFAKRLGADYIYNPTKVDINEFIRLKTNDQRLDVLLEMSGSASAFLTGSANVKVGGDIIAFGVFPKPFEFDFDSQVIFKGVTIHGIVGRKMWDTWKIVEDLLDNNKVDLSKIVTHTYKLEEFEKAFETMESGQSGKVMMTLE